VVSRSVSGTQYASTYPRTKSMGTPIRARFMAKSGVPTELTASRGPLGVNGALIAEVD
jgi:hypothetical protein